MTDPQPADQQPAPTPAPALSTRERVQAWRAQDPEATGTEIAKGLGIGKSTVLYQLRLLGLPTQTPRSRRNPNRAHAFTDRAFARAAARKGGHAKAARSRREKYYSGWRNPLVPASPYQGTILDAMDAAGLVAPTWARWRTFWRAVFALPMDDADRETLTEFAERSAPTRQVEEAWMVIGRRGGKSRNAAVCAAYLAIRRDYTTLLAPGEQAVIPVIAAEKKQARQVLGYLKGLARMPAFAPYVARVLKESVEFHTGVVVEVHTASYRTTRGYTVVCLVADEVAFWRSDEAAEPDKEILEALRPGMATVPGALLLGLSTPYARRGELFDTHRQHYGQDTADVLVWNAATRSMNPSVTRRWVERRWEKDPVVAASEYGPADGGQVVFRRDVEAFLDPEIVRSVMVTGRHELPPQEGITYQAFVDPSGGSADSFTLAIAHREEQRVVLDLVRETRAPFKPSEPVKEYAEVCERYGVGWVTGDRYAGGWPRERFADNGIGYEPSERPKSDIYRELLPLINGGQAELLDLPRLFTQLVALDRRTARGGHDTIDMNRRRQGDSVTHDDVANAAAGALVLAGEGLSSSAKDPAEDKPFEAFSPDGLRAEYEAGHRSKPHREFQPKGKNVEFGVQ